MKSLEPINKNTNDNRPDWRKLAPTWFIVTAILIFLCWMSSGLKEAVATTLMLASIILLGITIFKWKKISKISRIVAFCLVVALFNIGSPILTQIREAEKQSANTQSAKNEQPQQKQPEKQPEAPKFNPALAQDANFQQGEKDTVTEVIDGDTIRTSNHSKIRLVGLDTPETKHPRKPVQCFGREASQKMNDLVAGKTVYLVADPTQSGKDKYGRDLFYIYLEDGTNVAYTMIREGYGHEYTYNSNPHRWQSQFREAQRLAREENKGLWSPSTCSGNTEKSATQQTAPAAPAPQQTQPSDVSFSSCKEARAAGYSNMRRGEPGYSPDLDRDGDGVACESRRR